MNLSWRWLNELVDLDGIAPSEAASRLTFHTAEIEEVRAFGSGLDGVVTARVVAVLPHPGADRLRLVTLDPGDGSRPEVVCGAPNVAAGQVVAYAPIGTTLPGGRGEAKGPITLVARSIRGVESRGMVCAEDELGLGDDHAGILVLPADTPIGRPLREVVPTDDTILSLSNIAITHRPDLWGHRGFARELAALFERPLLEAARAPLDATGEPFPVAIEAVEDCVRYAGLVVEGLDAGPSPLAWRRRLEAVGQRSVDAIVDLTNLVLFETGQPLHAFDLAALRGGRIVVRRARPGEPFVALDGAAIALTADDLVIADASGVVAVAGVTGGRDSGVRSDTRAVLLESAWFAPRTIRATANRLARRTEASMRFEKGLDPEGVLDAAARFLALARTRCPDARVARPVADVRTAPPRTRTISLPLSLVRRRLGVRLADAIVRSRLHSLGFRVEERGTTFDVAVPSWRAGGDVRLPEDLVEEIGRLGGYDAVAPLAPLGSVTLRDPPPRRRLERRILPLFALERGWIEVQNYSFHGVAEGAPLGLDVSTSLRLAGLPDDRPQGMAPTTLARLLATAARQRGVETSAAVFESARVFAPRERSLPLEVAVVGGVAWDETGDAAAGRAVLHVVADLRAVLARAGLADIEIERAEPPALASGLPAPAWWHPGRRAVLRARGEHLGSVGEFAPRVSAAHGFSGRVAGFEVSLDAIALALAKPGPPLYEAPLKFPVVPFDVAVVVPVGVAVAEVARRIVAAAPDHVRNVGCFDVYEGPGIEAGHRSIAFRMELFDRARTLDGAAAEALRARVVAALHDAGYSTRGP